MCMQKGADLEGKTIGDEHKHTTKHERKRLNDGPEHRCTWDRRSERLLEASQYQDVFD